MTAPHHDPTDEDQSFSVLNDYLEQLHAGDAPDREQLRTRHPDLAECLECLDALDELAAPRDGRRRASAPTMPAPKAVWSPPPEGSRTPTDFGKYELLAEIGRGGMGV